ncbi:MAG: IS1595 family transposase [Alphaproteobacteria bacterium]
MSELCKPHYRNEPAAYRYVEAMLWPNGPVCPHCGGTEKIGKLKGKSTRMGVHKCYDCKKPFTVKIGTIFEKSHVAMHLWLQAIYLMASSKKGVSSNQLHRTLGVTLKTAWFMSHRIREAMRTGALEPLGGNGKVVEADETYYGKREVQAVSEQRKGRPYISTKPGKGISNKNPILALVERGGNVRSFHIRQANKDNVQELVRANIDRESTLYTDESRLYSGIDSHVAEHDTVHHASGEYVRGDVHSNTVESYFSVFKRGMRGVYQHCKEKHLHRYLAEFDFRHNHRVAVGVGDLERAESMLLNVKGKRLTYETTR